MKFILTVIRWQCGRNCVFSARVCMSVLWSFRKLNSVNQISERSVDYTVEYTVISRWSHSLIRKKFYSHAKLDNLRSWIDDAENNRSNIFGVIRVDGSPLHFLMDEWRDRFVKIKEKCLSTKLIIYQHIFCNAFHHFDFISTKGNPNGSYLLQKLQLCLGSLRS